VTVFYVVGGLTAAWAVVVAFLGIRNERFPGSRGATRIVMGLSLVLVGGAIGTAVVAGALEEEGEEAEAAPEAEVPPGAEEVDLSADPGGDLAFDTDSLEAPPGEVALVMENPSQIPHNVSLEGEGVDEEGPTVEQGGTSTVAAELEPGEYTFYCSVSGHREGGMEGTLTVR
jgi:plastocyanin